MSLYSLIGMTRSQRRQDADVEWLDQFTQNTIADSDTTAQTLADQYEKAYTAWFNDKLSAEKYGEMIRLEEAAGDAWELALGNHAERFRLNAMQ